MITSSQRPRWHLQIPCLVQTTAPKRPRGVQLTTILTFKRPQALIWAHGRYHVVGHTRRRRANSNMSSLRLWNNSHQAFSKPFMPQTPQREGAQDLHLPESPEGVKAHKGYRSELVRQRINAVMLPVVQWINLKGHVRRKTIRWCFFNKFAQITQFLNDLTLSLWGPLPREADCMSPSDTLNTPCRGNGGFQTRRRKQLTHYSSSQKTRNQSDINSHSIILQAIKVSPEN